MATDLLALTPAELDAIPVEALERLYASIERRHAIRQVEPELRAAILRRCAELEDQGLAATIRNQLDEMHPGVVANEHWQELIPNLPALGAYWRPDSSRTLADPMEEEMRADAENPAERLPQIVRQIARFVDNRELLIASAVAHARRCQIPEATFVPIITAAVREQFKCGESHVG